LNPELPLDLERIINRALEKDRNLRYQHAADLRAELQRLKRDTDSNRSAVVSEDQVSQVSSASVPAVPSGQSPVAPSGTSVSAASLQSGSANVPANAVPSKKKWFFVTAAALVLSIALVTFFYSRRAVALSEKDFVLLTDFVNTTGDPVFDGTLKQALAVQLEQSPFLNVYPQERVKEALQYAGHSPDERVTVPIARDICQREAIKAVLTGSVSSLGSSYVDALEALNCRTGDTIARRQGEAPSQEKVLAVLGTAAKELRGPLGENVSSIERFSAPIEQATTSSLEAMKAYAVGDEKRAKEGDLESLPFYKHAAEIDPNFAMAYARMGAVYGNLEDSRLSGENTRKAFDLRKRTSERERLYINAHYYSDVTGETEKSIENYKLWIETYPRDWTAHNNIVGDYIIVGENQKAIAEALETLRLQPNDVLPYQNAFAAYSVAGQFEEAKAIYAQALSRKFDSAFIHRRRYDLAFRENHEAEMARQIAWGAGKTEEWDFMMGQAETAAFRGQLMKARDFARQAADSARKNNLQYALPNISGLRCYIELWLGDVAIARSLCAQSLKSSDNEAAAFYALGSALAGDLTTAQSLIAQQSSRHPKHSVLNNLSLPIVKAAIEIKRGNPDAAFEALKTETNYETSDITSKLVRGLALLASHKGAELPRNLNRS
jgi:tetratricopeptide (TPR) repeat protein